MKFNKYKWIISMRNNFCSPLMKPITLTLLLILFGLILAPVFAQPQGNLDTTFGTSGTVVTAIPGKDLSVLDMEIGLNGKIGILCFGPGPDTMLLYNQDGSLDTSFNGSGFVEIDLGVPTFATGMVFQSDGKIIVSATVNIGSYSLGMIRYNQNGTVDASFDSDGIVIIPAITADRFGGQVAVQSTGKIILTGFDYESPVNYFLARFNVNGTLDNTFGLNGLAKSNLPTGKYPFNGYPGEVLIKPNDKIVVGGDIGSNNLAPPQDRGRRFGACQFSSEGSNEFCGLDRNVAYDLFEGFARNVGIQPDGKIIVVGLSFKTPGFTAYGASRFNADGSLDIPFSRPFGANNPAETGWTSGAAIYPTAIANSVVVQSNRKIIMVGATDDDYSGNDHFSMLRINTDGMPDGTSWNGLITGNAQAHVVKIQQDGKIVVAGDKRINDVGVVGLLRYNGETPTAANASISGRVKTSAGRGISRVRMTLTSQSGVMKTAMTNPFGYYRFTDLPVGEFYVLAVAHKKYQFTPNSRTFELFDDLDEVIFTADSTDNGRK
jgi:uncharacterized delta-60 repeat protein